MANTADPEDWTARDDEQLRGALATLRHDVDALPLPDVRFVRARGVRRRRQRALALTAAAAAAAVVVGAVGFSQLGRDTTLPVTPATRSSSPAPTATPTATATDDPLAEPGLLPLARDWERTLDLPAGSATVTKVTKGGGVECGDTLGAPTRQDAMTQASSPVSGGATYWLTDVPQAAANTLIQGVGTCQNGPSFTVKSEYVGAYAVFSYSTPEAGSGWFAVVPGRQGVALLQVIDPAFNDVASGGFTVKEVSALAELTRQRLDRYGAGSGSASPSAPSTAPAIGPTGSTRALSQDMPVSGPQPAPVSPLFVAASQWRSPALSGSVATSAGQGALEGSTTVASCETDEQQAGIGGRVGVVSVKAGTGPAGYIGRQRVQLDESSAGEVQQSYVAARLAEAKALFAKGCRVGNGTVSSTAGPSEGTYRLETVLTDGTAPFTEWVGVTAQRTPGAVSTIVITKMSDPKQGFAELDRLLMLARQK
ncbi:hypothetical protein ABEG17_04135 [Pedococcus sp. KACC 23699]|uniref:Uncharacterized protein n=1 Tax=Pedococcus sp. KACC 23699 TaxID=3149228 RepID=A0AAU7JWD3_9MICO